MLYRCIVSFANDGSKIIKYFGLTTNKYLHERELFDTWDLLPTNICVDVDGHAMEQQLCMVYTIGARL